MHDQNPRREQIRNSLQADCENCFGLCCVALPFAASVDFAIDKHADLRMTDLIGADFRDADLSGADLTGSIFLTQVQVNSAKGDAQTKLSHSLSPPMHWSD